MRLGTLLAVASGALVFSALLAAIMEGSAWRGRFVYLACVSFVFMLLYGAIVPFRGFGVVLFDEPVESRVKDYLVFALVGVVLAPRVLEAHVLAFLGWE